MHERFKRHPELLVLTVNVLLGAVFFSLANPKTVPPAFFILGFVFLMVGLYCVLRLMGRAMGLQQRLQPLTYNTLLAEATLLPIMLLALQSIGQLDAKSTMTLIVFFVGGYFYLSRLRT